MRKFPLDLGKRERQIVESVYRLGEASVAEVLQQLTNPPSYSAVRAMLGQLVEKGVLKYRQDGKRYLYRPAVPKERARRSALQKVLSTFFVGEPLDAMAALLDVSAKELTNEDLQRMKRLIEQTQRENRT
ncbi:MAG: BlaI/MecI/CopY family transcriptional regulator [Pirellulales bacterium]